MFFQFMFLFLMIIVDLYEIIQSAFACLLAPVSCKDITTKILTLIQYVDVENLHLYSFVWVCVYEYDIL